MFNSYGFSSSFPSCPATCILAEDFTNEGASDILPPYWKGDAIASGTGVIIDTNDYANGGVLKMANNGTDDNSGFNLQLRAEVLQLGLGRTFQFGCRLKNSEVIQCDWLFGISIIDSNVFSTYPTNGVWIESADGVATFASRVRTGAAFVEDATMGTAVADTYIYPAMKIVMDPAVAGKGVITIYVNGTSVGTWTSLNLPYAEALAPVCAWQSGDTAAMACYVDSLYYEMTRA